VPEEHTYSDASINAKIIRLAESGADLFMDATTPKFVVQAIRQIDALGWDPIHIVWGVGSSIGGVLEPAGADISKGILTGIWLKDYTNPAVKNDDDVKLFGEKLVEYDSDLNPADQNAAAGWYACHGTKDAFEKMQEPTRDELMKVMRNLDNVELPLLLDGITVSTSGKEDGYPIESIQIAEFDGEKYVTVGDVISYEGKTPKYVPRK